MSRHVLSALLSGLCLTATEAIVTGVDYYPEQWDLNSMQADMKAIKHDLGANTIRVAEFMWSSIEPSEGSFNFTLLDAMLDEAEKQGLQVMLGTPSATMPAWLYTNYRDEVVAQGPDSADGYAGVRPEFGGRRQYSFNSEVYQAFVSRMVRQLARRYGQRDCIKLWQVDNELGHEGSDLDFSPLALKAWRRWLTSKYSGDISRLNDLWGTVFWSATYASFDQVPLPHYTYPGGSLSSNENFRSNLSPGMLLDYRRFRRDSINAFAKAQVDILRDEGVKGRITTNTPGGFWGKAMDSSQLFEPFDLAAYDNYPVWGGSTSAPAPASVALILDTVRNWSPANTGWLVAEQLIGAQGHDIIGFTPRPNQAVAWSSAALLHGAEGLLFFRYRAAVFGQEEFCYGILDHTTPRGTGRKWNEAKAVFQIAQDHESLWLTRANASVAVVYDMENAFAWQAQPQSTAFDFTTEMLRLYFPFWRHGVALDVITASKVFPADITAQSLLDRYRVLVLPAPMLVLGEDQDSLHGRHVFAVLEEFVRLGGSVWCGFRSDIKDANSQIRRTPSRLATLAGVHVEEIESLNSGMSTTLLGADNVQTSTASVFREGLAVDSDDVEVLWQYTDSFFGSLGYAAVTRRPLGRGEVVYVGTGLDSEDLVSTASRTLRQAGIQALPLTSSEWVEQLERVDSSGERWIVTINHSEEEMPLHGRLNVAPMDPFEVRIERA